MQPLLSPTGRLRPAHLHAYRRQPRGAPPFAVYSSELRATERPDEDEMLSPFLFFQRGWHAR
ncbi:hypothetical protein FHY09_002245 [Xanthomonas sp. 60]